MVAAGSITVAVRVRPPSEWEACRLPEPCYDSTFRGDGALSTPGRSVANTSTLREIVQVVDDRILTFDPAEQDRAKAFMERGFVPPGTKRYKDKRFMFDRVYNYEARQQEVFEGTAQPLLKGVLDGYNATVFAYGATGCGKTHTISGTETDPGIIYLTMADLFQRIEERKDNHNVEVMVTFLEIYNEEIRDLLSDPSANAHTRGGLSIREDKTVKVVGLTELKPQTAEEVKEIVLLGNSRRTQSPTHANETSSRSHAVLQVHVTQSPRTASMTEERTMGTLSIIDLAGSERAAATSNMGQRMVEGANINKSLLALGNCINALCESGGSLRHIPYRNSKLTRLLKFSLGGNCKTVMIVCVAPTSNHFDDTHNTLVYADRATKIKTKVVTRNVVNVDRHVGRYVEAITRLNAEVAELKAKLAGKVAAEGDVQKRRKAEAKADIERAKEDMKTKADRTQTSIVDGAACTGKVSVAKAKLRIIRKRLDDINALATADSPLSPDLEAERALLEGMASPEEAALKPESALNVRLQRSNNSLAMFEATLRAVSERKSDKLDEVGVDHIKLNAKCTKADMERLKAEGERDAMSEAVETMAEMVVGLMGMLARCTVMVGEAGKVLSGAVEMSDEISLTGTVGRVSTSLKNVKERNDEAFQKLVGRSTESYTMTSNVPGSSLDVFKGYSTSFAQRRTSTGPAAISQPPAGSSRRSSVYGSLGAGRPSLNASAVTSPGRRHRTPRKSLRSSLTAQPYRRVSEKEKKGAKNVQWRDEAGQGNLDDRSYQPDQSAVFTLTPPEEVGVLKINPPVLEPPSTVPCSLPRSTSLGGSESEWEDENEKTDDSVHLNFMSMSLPPSSRVPYSSAGLSKPVGGKRPRASRLDPGFLKSKSKGSVLGSLAEDDESGSPVRRPNPLSDRNVNQMPTPDDSSASGSSASCNNDLHVPKSRERHAHNSPARRAPSTPRLAGKGMGSSIGTSKGAGSGRRRSNIGPMRSEKGRRRSSLIPQLSPPNHESHGGSRRIHITHTSPAKRMKRISLTGQRPLLSMPAMRSKPTFAVSSVLAANLSVQDPNGSADISFNKSMRPTWR